MKYSSVMKKDTPKLKLAIYGLGNFGYAFLKHFDKKKKNLVIYGYDQNKKLLLYLKNNRRHLFLHQEYKVSKGIVFAESVQELLNECKILVLAIPSSATREVTGKIKPYLLPGIIIVNTAKALDYKTGKRLSRIIKDELKKIHYYYAQFAGGTIASDLFKHEPLGATIACENKKILPKLTSVFQSSNLRIYPTTDLAGVEYASSFKNIVSVLAGIINGMGFSYGSETHIISRIADEIEGIVTTNFGGKKDTFSMKSQAWGNDLWMSCTGSTRNKEFGILLGRGVPVEKALFLMKKQNKTIEGVNTIFSLNKIVSLKNYPLLRFLHLFIARRKIKLNMIKKIIFNNIK